MAFTDVDAGNLALHVGDEPDAVRQHRTNLASAMDVEASTLLFMNQVHSAHVSRADQLVPVGPPAPDIVPDAVATDGMVSPAGAHPMAVMVADCLPVVLAGFDPDTGAVTATAVVHAGRQGLATGIIDAATDSMESAGGGRMQAWIGPSVCGSCYEVPEAMAADVAEAVPSVASRTRQGTAGLDLAAGASSQLASRGVQVERIAGCTMEESRLFSHRRNQRTGRFAGLVWRG